MALQESTKLFTDFEAERSSASDRSDPFGPGRQQSLGMERPGQGFHALDDPRTRPREIRVGVADVDAGGTGKLRNVEQAPPLGEGFIEAVAQARQRSWVRMRLGSMWAIRSASSR